MMKTKRAKLLKAAATLALGVAFTTAADASITFLPGNNPQPGEENILFGAKEIGTTINGATNTSDVGIQFTSTDTLLQNSSGQASITNNAGGALTNVTVTASGYIFTDFIANLLHANGSTLDVSVKASNGTFTDSFTGGPGNGSNFITILAAGGETISSITFSSPDTGFGTFDQPRISGLAAIPEPSTWALMMLGFAGLGYAGYRKARSEISMV